MAALCACSDDSSSPSSPAISPVSSGAEPVYSSSVDGNIPLESSSSQGVVVDPGQGDSQPTEPDNPGTSEVETPSGEGLLYSVDPTIAVTADEDGFYDMADIYKAVPTTSKIAFIIRHSERESGLGQESPLTEGGVAAAQALGARMGGDEPFYYASTDFVRTRETAKNIAAGRGETAEVITWDGIDGNYFYREDAVMSIDSLAKKSQNITTMVARYCYDFTFPNGTTHELVYSSFYPLMERGYQFVNEVILANMGSWNRVSILVSHDVLAEPLLVYATNRAIDLRFHETKTSGRWVNFMSGIAVVVNEAGAVSLFPVRGYDVGWMTASK